MKQIFRNIMTGAVPKFQVEEKVFFREPFFLGIGEGKILSVKTNIFHRVTYIIEKHNQEQRQLFEVLEDDIFRMN